MTIIRNLLISTCLLASPAIAEECVDVSLVLLADVSSSMDSEEKAIQRIGYADAFRHDEVISAIMGGYCGAIAVTYVEFASEPFPIVDWRAIRNFKDAEAFSLSIDSAKPAPVNDRNGLTDLSRALEYAGEAFGRLGVVADRQVIDLSADGPDNVDEPVNEARDTLTTATAENGWREITINGLTVGNGNYTMSDEDFQSYFASNVIGGPGSFLIRAKSAAHLREIVRKKLVQEIG